MNKKYFIFIFGIFSLSIYLLLIYLLVFYSNSQNKQKYKHYVNKSENKIRVSMITLDKERKKYLLVKKIKHKNKPKTIKKIKENYKKIKKEKIVKIPKRKHKKHIKKTVSKKINRPKNLFANIGSNTKHKPKKTVDTSSRKSANELFSSVAKIEKKSSNGVKNSYISSIEEKLKGWPAQRSYAGEKAKVWFRVEKDGSFIFKIISGSSNEDFNLDLVAYLKQLQNIGFIPHERNRAYTLNVEFVATQ